MSSEPLGLSAEQRQEDVRAIKEALSSRGLPPDRGLLAALFPSMDAETLSRVCDWCVLCCAFRLCGCVRAREYVLLFFDVGCVCSHSLHLPPPASPLTGIALLTSCRSLRRSCVPRWLAQRTQRSVCCGSWREWRTLRALGDRSTRVHIIMTASLFFFMSSDACAAGSPASPLMGCCCWTLCGLLA